MASQAHKIPSHCIASLHNRWQLITWEDITWHRVASPDLTQHKKSHHIKWHDITSNHITWHDISRLTKLPHIMSPHNQPHYFISPCNQSRQNRSPHHHHGTAEGPFTQKTRFGHRAGWPSGAHSIGKFFLWLILFFLWNFPPQACPALLVYEVELAGDIWVWSDCESRWRTFYLFRSLLRPAPIASSQRRSSSLCRTCSNIFAYIPFSFGA